MNIRRKVFAGAAILTALGTAGAAGPAFASSTGCAFTNGCATLHGTDANNHAIAMDAKHQSAKAGTLLIGYPDVPGDGATSFDAVLHYTKGAKKTTYADTGFTLSPTFTSVPCLLTTDPKVTPGVSGSALTAGSHTLSVQSTTGTVTASPSSGSSIVLGGSGTLEIDEQYASDGSSCVAAYHATYPPLAIAPSSPDTAPLTYPTSPGGSTWTFLDSDSGGTFSFTGLPAGVSVSGGALTADTSTATPGTYTNVGVTYTATDGAVFTATFTLVVSGIKTVNPGNDIPYYSFAYAKGGVWTNMCVTDNGGSAALVLATCTLGHDQYQDFYAETVSGGSGAPVLLSGGSYFIQNKLAAVTSPSSSCLTDPSALDPATPESDATDESAIPAGRQLRVDGVCLGANAWTWAS